VTEADKKEAKENGISLIRLVPGIFCLLFGILLMVLPSNLELVAMILIVLGLVLVATSLGIKFIM
jgi:uncharacterized membrane protein